MLWDTLFELVNGLLKVLDIRFDVGEELMQQITDIVGGLQLEYDGEASFVLVEDSGLAVFKDGIGQGILVLNLFRDFSFQIGLWSFGLPVATPDTKLVQQDTIGSNLAQRHLRG